MKNLVIKVIGYLFLRYLVFFATITMIDKNVKWMKLSDIKDKEDWFMFLWLFGLPIIIEVVILTFPFSYGLNKIENNNVKIWYYLLFISLFLIEYLIANWLIGLSHPLIKIILSSILFAIVFRKHLF